MTATTHGDGLAALIRESSETAHRQAENTPFIQNLMSGRLELAGYLSLVVQQHAIYRTLESLVVNFRSGDLAELFDPSLDRLAAIEADITDLGGPHYVSQAQLTPATIRYCQRLEAAAAAGEPEILAHHYVRYMGDLSGGQVIGRAMSRIYNLPEGRGTSFYRFDAIESPKEFKGRYREHLDALDWNEPKVRRLVGEVDVAYRLNTDVFNDLDSPDLLSEYAPS